MTQYDYLIQLKSDKTETVAFAEGPAGEILYIAAFPGREQQVDRYKYKQLSDRILNHNHHIKEPQEYNLIMTVLPDGASTMFGLPELKPELMAKADLRQGIRTVTADAIKDIRG